MAAHDAMALAGRCLQPHLARDGDVAPAVANEASPLQRSRRLRDTRPVDTEHESDEFLDHRELIALGPVMHNQQPPQVRCWSCYLRRSAWHHDPGRS